MTKVTILCGESPLPVCQALKTLNANEVVVVHGNGNALSTAERVRDFCLSQLNISHDLIHLVAVDPWDPSLRDLFDFRHLLENSSLVFGPGTSVMNAMIHDWWRFQKGNEHDVGQSWYLQATPSQLIASNPNIQNNKGLPEVIPVTPTGLDIGGIASLHVSNAFIVHKSAPLTGTAKKWFHNNQLADIPLESPSDIGRIISPFVSDVLYRGEAMRRNANDELILKEDTDARRLLESLGISPNPGFFLEVAVYAYIGMRFVLDELVHSFEIARPKSSSRREGILEMDVTARRDDRTVWISCGTTRKTSENALTGFRNKFHEVTANSMSLCGKEARSITVVNRFAQSGEELTFENRLQLGQDLRRRLGLPETPGVAQKHIVIDIAELLGAHPTRAFSGDDQSPSLHWVREWLEISLGTEFQTAPL
jgi:hypothetical protein